MMSKKYIVQTGSSEYLEDLGLVILSHMEPNTDIINVFVVEDDEYSQQPNPYKANVLKKFSFSAEDTTIDEALDEVISLYKK